MTLRGTRTPSDNPHDLLPIAPSSYFILLSLSEGKKHGYAIIQEIRRSSNDQIILNAPTLYGSLKRLVELRLVEEIGDGDNERRRVYRITDLGRRVVELEALRLVEMVRLAQDKNVLSLRLSA